jgi:hypothetical protein
VVDRQSSFLKGISLGELMFYFQVEYDYQLRSPRLSSFGEALQWLKQFEPLLVRYNPDLFTDWDGQEYFLSSKNFDGEYINVRIRKFEEETQTEIDYHTADLAGIFDWIDNEENTNS